MGFILESMGLELVCGLFLLLWLFYWYLTMNYDYWQERGVPCHKPQFPYGSTRDIILARTFAGKAHDHIYQQFPGERYYGIVEFRKPVLVLRDPELIKRIMVKDFQHFVDRPVLVGNPKEYILKHLLTLVGQEWKDMRAKLTPTFTSGKMKLMFALMEKCSDQLKAQIETNIEDGKVVDAKDILARFTLDSIASCAFGLDSNTLQGESAALFQTLRGAMKTNKYRYLRRIFVFFFPEVIKAFRMNLIRPKVRDFLTDIVRDTVEYRQKNNVKRNDFVDLLMNIKHIKSEQQENGSPHAESQNAATEGLTVEQMTAQAFVFILASFETASSLMSFCLYELSRHPDIQERLYREVQEAAESHGGVTYQTLLDIPYLDQVINETLRLYGTVHTLSRVCTQDYTVQESDLVVEKGMKVLIPVYALHHDPAYFPDPYVFDPERFTPQETAKRHPYVFLPFGEGPRNCIGMRFGLLQAKIGLTTVLLNFKVELSPEQEVPIEVDKLAIVLLPAKPVLLKFSKRKP